MTPISLHRGVYSGRASWAFRVTEEEAMDRDLINQFAAEVHVANVGWWHDPTTGEPLARNVGELLMLCVSELAEAMEGHRKDLQDDKLPHRKMIEVELADTVIRMLDISAGFGLDLGGAMVEKMAFNAQRADHKAEQRLK